MTQKEKNKQAVELANKARETAAKGRDKFLSGLDDYSKEFFDLLKKEINKLDTKGGKIDRTSEANKKIIKSISIKINDALSKTAYKKNVIALLENFNTIATNTANAAQIVNNIKVSESLLTTAQRNSRDNAVEKLLGQGLNANFVNPIVEIVNKQVNLGGNLQDLIAELDEVINPAQKLGILSSYATRMGRDVLFQMQGEINQAIANEYDLDAFAYIGTEIEDTRAQCTRWLDKEVIKIDELQDEIDWAYKNGSGMIEGTTPSTFAIDRGGYNCRHAAIPVNSKTYNQ